jgi:hypothetical protein
MPPCLLTSRWVIGVKVDCLGHVDHGRWRVEWADSGWYAPQAHSVHGREWRDSIVAYKRVTSKPKNENFGGNDYADRPNDT